jgi:PTS system galactitol-specific IIA component
MLKLTESSILVNLAAENCDTVIHHLADALHQQGFVTADYGKLTCLRETKHPTGLPTRPFCIAFPHADSDGVIHSALAVAILEKPVYFKNMADPTEDLSVELVIMLANANPEEQIQTLRSLATLFGEGEKLTALKSQPSPAEAANWLRQALQLNEPAD